MDKRERIWEEMERAVLNHKRKKGPTSARLDCNRVVNCCQLLANWRWLTTNYRRLISTRSESIATAVGES